MQRFFFFMFSAGCAFGGGLISVFLVPRLVNPAAAQSQLPAVVYPAPLTDVVKVGDRFEMVARRVGAAVVAVEATKPAATGAKSSEEAGSGVIVRLDGRSGSFVITNNHVVTQARPDHITITMSDGKVMRPAQVWADPESDIALLKVPGDDLPHAPLGDSDRARVGQWVLAFGSPFGLNQTVTHGIISARERGQVSLGSTIRIKDFLQTDAAINPGSSGGPLVNLEGEVVGINTAIASQSGSNSGVAFSIPVNLVKRVTRELLDKGTVSRGYLGMQLAPVFDPADALKLGLDRVQGALVEMVLPDSPAAAAGLKAKDVILQVDGLPIRNENHLINLISTLPAGQKVRLQVWRDRQAATLDATIGDWAKAQPKVRSGM